jgi:hypothetical protein
MQTGILSMPECGAGGRSLGHSAMHDSPARNYIDRKTTTHFAHKKDHIERSIRKASTKDKERIIRGTGRRGGKPLSDGGKQTRRSPGTTERPFIISAFETSIVKMHRMQKLGGSIRRSGARSIQRQCLRMSIGGALLKRTRRVHIRRQRLERSSLRRIISVSTAAPICERSNDTLTISCRYPAAA